MKLIAYELLFAFRVLDAAGDIEPLWSTHGFGILTGLFERTHGWKPAGAINATGYIVWSLWLLISGVLLILA